MKKLVLAALFLSLGLQAQEIKNRLELTLEDGVVSTETQEGKNKINEFIRNTDPFIRDTVIYATKAMKIMDYENKPDVKRKLRRLAELKDHNPSSPLILKAQFHGHFNPNLETSARDKDLFCMSLILVTSDGKEHFLSWINLGFKEQYSERKSDGKIEFNTQGFLKYFIQNIESTLDKAEVNELNRTELEKSLDEQKKIMDKDFSFDGNRKSESLDVEEVVDNSNSALTL